MSEEERFWVGAILILGVILIFSGVVMMSRRTSGPGFFVPALSLAFMTTGCLMLGMSVGILLCQAK